MGRPKGSTKDKNPFEDLPEEFQGAVDGGTEDQIRRLVADVAFNEAENKRLQSEDIDLKEKKEIAKEANAGYKEATDMNKLKIKYARQVMDARGKL